LLCFPNGVIDTDEYVETGKFRLLDSEPDLFHLSHRPFAFDPTAQCPLWRKFLNESLPELDKQRLLQEWFGINLIPDNSLEKLMLLYGLRRSGKGLVLTVMRSMLGSENVASTNFQQLGEKYGLETLVGRLAAHIGDARLSARGVDSMSSLETLLTVVGNDTVGIRRMAKDTLANIHLYARFSIATNDIPTFPDHAGALEARILPLHFNISFESNPDTTLKERIPREAPAITLWALQGLKRLRDNGNQFTIPESSRLLLQQIRYRMSPIAEFMDECLHGESEEGIKTRVAYGAYRNWAMQSGLHVGSYTWFRETLAKQGSVEFGDRGQTIIGVQLTQAGRQFLVGQ
jgi:putative DNA primase/helicase